jgi:hypothetical protein
VKSVAFIQVVWCVEKVVVELWNVFSGYACSGWLRVAENVGFGGQGDNKR